MDDPVSEVSERILGLLLEASRVPPSPYTLNTSASFFFWILLTNSKTDPRRGEVPNRTLRGLQDCRERR